jgi:hypothetical protein
MLSRGRQEQLPAPRDKINAGSQRQPHCPPDHAERVTVAGIG